jgi:hypothetical protein
MPELSNRCAQPSRKPQQSDNSGVFVPVARAASRNDDMTRNTAELAEPAPARSIRDRGASIVELALVAPVMVLLVFGVLDLATGYRMQIRLENAAREGAVFAQVRPNRVDGCADGKDIVSRVHAEDDGLASMPIEVVVLTEDGLGAVVEPVSGCSGSHGSPGKRQRVEVSAVFDVMTPMVERIVGDTIVITGAAEIEVQGG